jgi:hypothetical protein
MGSSGKTGSTIKRGNRSEMQEIQRGTCKFFLFSPFKFKVDLQEN